MYFYETSLKNIFIHCILHDFLFLKLSRYIKPHFTRLCNNYFCELDIFLQIGYIVGSEINNIHIGNYVQENFRGDVRLALV